MNLAPGHASAVPREVFLHHALPARAAMFASAHVTGLDLTDAWENPIDADHVWLEGRWQLHLANVRTPTLDLASAFLLQRRAGDWHIVVCLNHNDIAAALGAATPDTAAGR